MESVPAQFFWYRFEKYIMTMKLNIIKYGENDQIPPKVFGIYEKGHQFPKFPKFPRPP